MFNFIQNLDVALLQMIQALQTDSLNKLMVFITHLGDYGILWISVSLLLFINKKTRKIGLSALISLAVCALIVNVFLKPIVHRIRPFDMITEFQILIKKPTDWSFPSGHTASAFTMTYVFYKYLKKYFSFVLILSILISFSRLYLTLHYPSDVIAGIIIGLLSGKIGVNLVKSFFEKLKKI